MAMSARVLAYGAVAVVGATLFIIGTPVMRVREAQADDASTVSGNGITLRSVSFQFPSSDLSFPGGAKAEVINNNCTACHSPDMVLTQPALSRERWNAEVKHMIVDFKAPVSSSDVPAIVDYLVSIRGAK
jgi:hypothetical protein